MRLTFHCESQGLTDQLQHPARDAALVVLTVSLCILLRFIQSNPVCSGAEPGAARMGFLGMYSDAIT